MSMTLGEYIRKLRLASGLSLRAVASASGISPTYLSLIELGKTKVPTTDRLEKIAKAIDVDSDELVFRAGQLPSDVLRALEQFPKQATHVLRYTGVTKMKRTVL